MTFSKLGYKFKNGASQLFAMVGSREFFLRRKPSSEKMKRGILLIESLSDELEIYDDGWSRGGEMFKTYPNWKTDYRDYSAMIHAARQIARNGLRLKVEFKGLGGMAGSQRLTIGYYYLPGQLDYNGILEKATDLVYERTKKQAPPKEDVLNIIEEFDRKPHQDYVQDWTDQRFRLGMVSRDEVRIRLEDKLRRYLSIKAAKISEYENRW